MYALHGIKHAFKTEHNTWIHLLLSITAIVLGFVMNIHRLEWLALVIVIAMVWTAELFNTAIEKIMDFISKERHPHIKLVKDIAAAAVLVTAVAAFITGCIVFIPKLF